MGKRGRGRPRKIKKLEEYTISELRDMPMGAMARLFFGDLIGKKDGVVSSPKIQDNSKDTQQDTMESSIVADLMGMTLEKKADYLADALMGYLKKAK